MKEERIREVANSLRMNHYHAIKALGSIKGLALLWDNDIDLEVLQ